MQGVESLNQLRKMAQGFPSQESGADDLDEDEVPSKCCVEDLMYLLVSPSCLQLSWATLMNRQNRRCEVQRQLVLPHAFCSVEQLILHVSFCVLTTVEIYC